MLEAADKPFDFKWPQPDGVRTGGPLLQLRHVGYTYPGAEAPVLHVSNAVCPANVSGSSTFLPTMLANRPAGCVMGAVALAVVSLEWEGPLEQ